MAPCLGRQADAVVQHDAGPFGAARALAHDVGCVAMMVPSEFTATRPGRWLAVPLSYRKTSARVQYCHPSAVHVCDEARGHATRGAEDHALAGEGAERLRRRSKVGPLSV